MIAGAEFWVRVHAALDRGADPLADAEVLAHLEADPELLQDYGRLVDALRAVEHERPAAVRAQGIGGTTVRVVPLLRRVAAWSGSAAAAALVWFLWPHPGTFAPLPSGDPLRVLHLRVVHATPAGLATYERSGAGPASLRIAAAPGPRVLRHVIETTSGPVHEVPP